MRLALFFEVLEGYNEMRFDGVRLTHR